MQKEHRADIRARVQPAQLARLAQTIMADIEIDRPARQQRHWLAELKTAFDANKDRLASPDAVRIRHIVVANEKEAADFLISIKAGADFAKLASQVSLDNGTKDRGGDAGFLPHGMLLPELEKAISGLKPGQVAGPVKTPLGYHLLKVEEVRSAAPAVFENVKGELRASLLADKVSKAWPDFLRELRAKAKIEMSKG